MLEVTVTVPLLELSHLELAGANHVGQVAHMLPVVAAPCTIPTLGLDKDLGTARTVGEEHSWSGLRAFALLLGQLHPLLAVRR